MGAPHARAEAGGGVAEAKARADATEADEALEAVEEEGREMEGGDGARATPDGGASLEVEALVVDVPFFVQEADPSDGLVTKEPADFEAAIPSAPALPTRLRSSFAALVEGVGRVKAEMEGLKDGLGPLLIIILLVCTATFGASVGAAVVTRESVSRGGRLVDASNKNTVLATASAEFRGGPDTFVDSRNDDVFFEDLTSVSVTLDDNATTAHLRVHGFLREPCEPPRCSKGSRVVLLTAETPVFVEDDRISHGPFASLARLAHDASAAHRRSHLDPAGAKNLCVKYGYYCGLGALGSAFRSGTSPRGPFAAFRYSWYQGYAWWRS